MKNIFLIFSILIFACNESNVCLTSYHLMERKALIQGVIKDVYSDIDNRGFTSFDISNYDSHTYQYIYKTLWINLSI